jgi:hypothetical protein
MADPLAWALGLAAAGWVAAGVAGLRGLARVPLLPGLPAPPPSPLPSQPTSALPSPLSSALPAPLPVLPVLPRASVVVPARDEAERIEGTLRRLLAQQHVELEIVVVDDRSRDATAEIVERVARTDPRVKLVRVAQLPPGWLGKTNACERGGRAASGEWLLFTDGDVWLAPDVLARALAHAQRESADHVVLSPSVEGQSFAACSATAAFGATMLPLLAAANGDRKHGGIGIGAFNLVRRPAWEAIGGHERLRLEVVDDIGLGKLLARGGFRTRACFAGREVVADWARRLRDVPRALEKNMFAQMDYSVVKALVFSALAIAFWLAPFVGLFTGSWTGWAAFAAMFCTIPASVKGARVVGIGLLPALASPLFFFALPWAMLNSMVVTLARGGVRWRDTFHPLAELRAGKVR